MSKRLLITGFDAFGGSDRNPSWLAVQQLPETLGEYMLCKLQIPTCFGKAAACVIEKARLFQPDLVLCIGLAGGRDAVTPERIAVNIRDAKIADNAGYLARGERIDPEGPAAYFSTVPVEAMAQAILDAGIPGSVSNTAGAFVCNDTLYTLLRHFDGTETKVGFIHVPRMTGMGDPSLPLETIRDALAAAILAC